MRAGFCIVLLLASAGVGCGKSEPGAGAQSGPVEIAQITEISPPLASVSNGDSESKIVDLKISELREVQQLREQLQRELGEIRRWLATSNAQLQLKQQAVETIRSRLSQ